MPNALQPATPVAEVSLALNLFRVAIPTDWVLEDDFPFHTVFRLPDGGTMTMNAIVYDNPEIERSGDYASLMADIIDASEQENLRKLIETWSKVPNLPVLTMSAQKQADDGAWFRNVWRSLDARPPIYRTVTWEFEPASYADGAALAQYADALHSNFQHIHFAEGLTDLDLVAATPELKVSSFGNALVMRIPVEWERKRQKPDGTGRHLIDEPVHDRWTLWVDWDFFFNTAEKKAPVVTAGLLAGLTGEATETVAAQGDQVIVQHYTAEDKDGPIRVVAWHRLGLRGLHIVIAHFSFVVDETKADLPELLAVRDLVGREAMRAVLIARPPRPKTA
jgi:hypothetical protein